MKLKHAALLATVLVILAGGALISPLFLRHQANPGKPRIMLSFSIAPQSNVTDWCRDLGSVLDEHQIGASVFITGSVAEQYPQCLTYFGDRIDIGSQTFSNSDLTQIADYSLKLEEVQRGKRAVDEAGDLVSQIFRAPFGATDQDIYSLLSRSGIMADFSYLQQYNVFQQGQFVKYAAAGFSGSDKTVDVAARLSGPGSTNLVFFDSSCAVSDIAGFLSQLDMTKYDFVNASQLAGTKLTTRGVKNGDRRFASY